MKIIKLNPPTSTGPGPTRRWAGKPTSSNVHEPADDRDEFNVEPWEYQGKRRDQLEGSYKMFAFSILAFLITVLIYLITRL